MNPKLRQFKYWPHVITLMLIIMAYGLYRYFAYYDTRTNDAYVSAHVVNIAPVVSGPVSELYIAENQFVKKGDKLFSIDPRPFTYALAKAEANLSIAQLQYANNKIDIEVAAEKLRQSKVLLNLRNAYYQRYQKLSSEGDLAKIALIDIEAKVHEQEATVSAAMEELRITEKKLDDSEVRAAKAVLSEAKYLADHTTVYAPEEGFITNFNVRRGQYVSSGQSLFALVETRKWWVVSRYRETAIRLIKPGDKAMIKLDMYPGKIFKGHVESIGWGINRIQEGNSLQSTLPFLEATEDWIQISQRFPVRIVFDDITKEFPLRIGASATTVTYRASP